MANTVTTTTTTTTEHANVDLVDSVAAVKRDLEISAVAQKSVRWGDEDELGGTLKTVHSIPRTNIGKKPKGIRRGNQDRSRRVQGSSHLWKDKYGGLWTDSPGHERVEHPILGTLTRFNTHTLIDKRGGVWREDALPGK